MNKFPESARTADYHGFSHCIFDFNGREANVILPNKPHNGLWIWRAEFLGAFDAVDVELLDRGMALVYYDISNMYGCPEAVGLMKTFYDFCTSELEFADGCVLLGFSRGGLYSANFALKYPSCVAGLYLDAPVLDIKSWPGGLGVGEGGAREYGECLECYGLTRSSALTYRETPVDRADELAALGIPLVMVAGDSDPVVPHVENAEILVEAYRRANTPLLYILKPGCAHHPHSVDDPERVGAICDFIEDHASKQLG